MKYAKMLGVGLLVASLAGMGCSGTTTSSTAKDTTKKEEHAPHGKGPNGGVIFDLGAEHAEFTVDHDKKECTILVIDGDNKSAKPKAVAAKEFTVVTKETKTKEGKVVAPMTIKMLAKDEKDGKASKFVGTDPGLGNVADFEADVVGTIDGKSAPGHFKE